MSAHTPGPWHRDQYGYVGAMVPGDVFGMPAQVSREICNMQKNPNINADARLIAAAPEMLDCLGYMQDFLRIADQTPSVVYAQAKVDAMIAKATGVP